MRNHIPDLSIAFVPILTLVAACASAASLAPSAAPSASPSNLPPLSVSNSTTIPVTLVVNGNVLETVGAGVRQDPITQQLPPRPWNIEARSPSGRTLANLTVGVSDYISTTSGRAVRVDLSCGRLDVWSGPAPGGGPTFIPGPSGDCQ